MNSLPIEIFDLVLSFLFPDVSFFMLTSKKLYNKITKCIKHNTHIIQDVLDKNLSFMITNIYKIDMLCRINILQSNYFSHKNSYFPYGFDYMYLSSSYDVIVIPIYDGYSNIVIKFNTRYMTDLINLYISPIELNGYIILNNFLCERDLIKKNYIYENLKKVIKNDNKIDIEQLKILLDQFRKLLYLKSA